MSKPTQTSKPPIVWRQTPRTFSDRKGAEWSACLGAVDEGLARWRLNVYYLPTRPTRVKPKLVSRRNRKPEPLQIRFTLYYDARAIQSLTLEYTRARPTPEAARTRCVRWATNYLRAVAQKVRELNLCS